MMMMLPSPSSTRYSLLSRLNDWDDQEGWREFFDTYWRLIYSVAMKSGLTDAEAKDVVQETVISVAKGIDKFRRDRTRGSFRGWLRNIIRWRIADYLKKYGRPGARENGWPAECEEPDIKEIADPTAGDLELLWDEEWQANLFEAALDRVKQKVKAEQYQMFDLYVVQKLGVREVARRLNVTVGHVYVAKHRVSALIKKEIRQLEDGQI